MKRSLFALTLTLALAPVLAAAQAPTSRTLVLGNIVTTLPPGGVQDLIVQLWDDPLAGTQLFSETQPGVSDDANSVIMLVFGSQTAAGLDPGLFPSGSSRFVDITTTDGTSVLAARVLLTATPFALNPGPQGAPGVVQTVTAADSSVAIGGTAADRVVAVAANGITNGHVANGALSPSKIAGTAATVGPNTFSGNQGILGNLSATGMVAVGDRLGVLGGFASIAGANNTLALGDIGCGAGTGAILPFGCGNYMLLGQSSGNTFINSSGAGGQIHFRHNDQADQMTILPGGNVGIGTTTPTAAKLVVNDTNVGTAVAGISATGSGVFGQSQSATGWGVYGQGGPGYAMYANGDTGQAPDKGGWVKAMVLLRSDGAIELCYNSTLTGSAASTPPCGLSAVQADAGQYIINFGFQINLRFLAATNAWAPAQPGTPAIFVSARPIDSQTIRVFTYGLNGNPDSCPFYLVVF